MWTTYMCKSIKTRIEWYIPGKWSPVEMEEEMNEVMEGYTEGPNSISNVLFL